jgi:hypothetical protein
MTSEIKNYTSETLRQGIKFVEYQDKIVKSVNDDKKKLTEGFTSSSTANSSDKSKILLSKTSQVGSAAQELNDLQKKFASTLERYKTAHAQLMSTTNGFLTFINNNNAKKNSILGKNIFVNTVVSNPSSDLIGVYADDSNSPAMNKLTGDYTYEQCQLAAIDNGKQYFALSDLNSSTNKGQCSISNDIDKVTKYGESVPKCTKGSDGKIYGNNLINALYSVNGQNSTYLGCYNDNENDRAMNASGTILSNLSSVYTTGSYNVGPWGAWNFIDKTAQWIWYTPNAARNAPYNARYPVTLLSSFNYTGTGYARATIYGICDNASVVYLNGRAIGRLDGGWGGGGRGIQIPITIAPGINYISAEVENMGGPAGFIMTIIGPNNNVLINTNSSWKYTNTKSTNLISNKQDYSVYSCQQYASSNGFKYFGLQGGKNGNSLCYVSNDLSKSKKYGSADSTKIGSDNKLYGKESVNVSYKIKDPGNIDYLGKVGYVDNNGILSEYPSYMINLNNNIPTIVKSNESCSKEILNVDSSIWKAQKKSLNMMSPSTKCGLTNAIQADQASVDELSKQLKEMSSRILVIINYLETLDATVIYQMGINKRSLDDMLKKYTTYNKQFSQLENNDIKNYEAILQDSKLVTSYNNYNYILWSGITLIILILTFQLIRKRAV